MSKVTTLYYHTEAQALECKKAFFDDYQMYCDYLLQYGNDSQKMVPVSEFVYNNLAQ